MCGSVMRHRKKHIRSHKEDLKNYDFGDKTRRSEITLCGCSNDQDIHFKNYAPERNHWTPLINTSYVCPTRVDEPNDTGGCSSDTKRTGHALLETTARSAEITNEPPVTLVRRQSTTIPE